MSRVEPRFMIAIVLTVVAVLGVAVLAFGGSGDKAANKADTSTSTTASTTTTVAQTTPTSSIEIPEHWYPKGSSRYSDRSPVASVSTLPPTTEATDTTTKGSSTRSESGTSTRSATSNSDD